MERYYVDRRGGCIAVMDSENVDPDNRGLHPDSPGVVLYWPGVWEKSPPCPTCGHCEGGYWTVPQGTIDEAEDICEELNVKGGVNGIPHIVHPY